MNHLKTFESFSDNNLSDNFIFHGYVFMDKNFNFIEIPKDKKDSNYLPISHYLIMLDNRWGLYHEHNDGNSKYYSPNNNYNAISYNNVLSSHYKNAISKIKEYLNINPEYAISVKKYRNNLIKQRLLKIDGYNIDGKNIFFDVSELNYYLNKNENEKKDFRVLIKKSIENGTPVQYKDCEFYVDYENNEEFPILPVLEPQTEPQKPEKIIQSPLKQKCYLYSKNLKLMREFDDIEDCAKYLNKNINKVHNAIANKSKIGNYYLSFKDDDTNFIIAPNDELYTPKKVLKTYTEPKARMKNLTQYDNFVHNGRRISFK